MQYASGPISIHALLDQMAIMLEETWMNLLIESGDVSHETVFSDFSNDHIGFAPSGTAVEDYSSDWSDWSDFSALEAWARYGPTLDTGDVVAGDPYSERYWWNYQGTENSCAVVAQQGVLESILHRDFSRSELTELAEERGEEPPPSDAETNRRCAGCCYRRSALRR